MPSSLNRSVLLVSNFLSASGGSRGVCEDLAERLSHAGWSVTTTSDKPHKLLKLVDMLATIWRAQHQYAVAQVDVFSGPAFFWAEASCWALRRLGKPYVLTLHGGNLPNFAKKSPDRVRRLLSSARVVTTPSAYLYEQMEPYRTDLTLLPNPINVRGSEFRLRDKPAPKLMWLRSFHAMYNPALAVKVLAQLQNEFPDITLTMVGPDRGDGSFQATQQLIASLSVGDRIHLPGGVPKQDVPLWLNKGDIFINTTHIDNTPVSVIEAMACGLCVVSTHVGGIPYLLEHEHDSLLVPPDDQDAMIAAVRRVLTEPGLAERLSQNGRAKVESFDWSVILPQWEKLLIAVTDPAFRQEQIVQES